MRTVDPPSFGVLLKHYRVAAGLTQEELATQARLSRNAVRELERAMRTHPRKDTVHLLAVALRLAAEDERVLLAAALQRESAGLGGIWLRGTVALPLPAAPTDISPTPLIGRTNELETIRRSLVVEGTRLLTLTGPAGVGKTRLALATPSLVADWFPDGAVVVDLARIHDPRLVLSTIARAIGVTDAGPPPLAQRLRNILRDRKMLLLLDNFERVLPAAGALANLLENCPGLVLLVTSSVPLRLRWERVVRISPLPVPDLNAPLAPLDELVRNPAVELFVERARDRRADFALTETVAPLVARLVVELDGLPLALELAAARLDTLSLPVIVHRLGDQLRLLRWEAADLPERQRSLEAAVGWSYGLLSESERKLFRYLGVFVCRVTLDAIAAVAVGAGDMGREGDILNAMVSLAETSLILPGRLENGEEDPEPVFSMLEAVREYAREILAAQGELTMASRAHAHYFLALAECADPQLRSSGQRNWVLRLEREHDNLRSALRWLLEQNDPEERAAALRLAGALSWFWWMRGYHVEGWHWLEEALNRAPAVDVEADLVNAAARTRALLGAGRIFMQQGEFERSRAVLEEALALARQRRTPVDVAWALTHLGARAVYAGDWAEGTRMLREALAAGECHSDPYYSGTALYLLGAADFAQGHREEAVPLEVDGLERLEKAGDARIASTVHFGLAMLAGQQDDLPGALRHISEGLQVGVVQKDRWLISIGARAALAIMGDDADPLRRAQLLGATDAMREANGATPVWERVAPDPSVAAFRERLERERLEIAYKEGRSLPFEEVADLAVTLLEDTLNRLERPELSQTAQEPPQRAKRQLVPSVRQENLLSEREREVLRLVAQGLTNKGIGQALFLSASTVNYHVTSIFNKLAVGTRAQAVAVAAQRGLL